MSSAVHNDKEVSGMKLLGISELSRMLGNFAVLSTCSIVIGISFGLLNSYTYKKLTALENNPVREIFLLLLFAYVSYIISEMLGFSGVITLFCCAFTMA